MATVNDVIDYDTAAIAASELGAKVEKEVVVTTVSYTHLRECLFPHLKLWTASAAETALPPVLSTAL